MPELPEVQTVVNDLKNAGLIGQTISEAQVYWDRIIHTPSSLDFSKDISKCKIKDIYRRAKYIVIQLSKKKYLLIHLRMTGKFFLEPNSKERNKHEHVIFKINKGLSLRYHDTRKFGRLYLVDDTDEILGKLGPEPLEKDFTFKKLEAIIKGKSKIIKPFLLDQNQIAGLGNIYVDETLWLAQIHPETNLSFLKTEDIKALHKGIQKSLKTGLKNMGTSLGNNDSNFYSVAKRKGRNSDQLNVFRRTDCPCPRCHTSIEKIIVAQRSTHYCPLCQTKKG